MGSKGTSSQNAAVKRIMLEVKELQREWESDGSFFHASPLENDLFEWHFTVRGPPDTAFQGGLYHGRIVLPPEYPMKAPEIVLLTPNGRFEVGTRVCLSITSHHQETWQPSWGIRTILTALVGFMPSKAEGIGSLNFPAEDRKVLAQRSHAFQCSICGCKVKDLFPENTPQQQPQQQFIPSSQNGEGASATAAAEAHDVPPPETEEVREQQQQQQQQHASAHPAHSQGSGASTGAVQQGAHPAPQPETPATTGFEGQGPPGHVATDSEKELKYAAYAILFVIVAIIVRRVLKLADIDLLL